MQTRAGRSGANPPQGGANSRRTPCRPTMYTQDGKIEPLDQLLPDVPRCTQVGFYVDLRICKPRSCIVMGQKPAFVLMDGRTVKPGGGWMTESLTPQSSYYRHYTTYPYSHKG